MRIISIIIISYVCEESAKEALTPSKEKELEFKIAALGIIYEHKV